MGRPAARWPSKALDSLEATVDGLKAIERLTSRVQDAIVLGKTAEALRDLSDVRVMALECVDHLVRARIGKYKQPDEGAQWQAVETQDTSTKAVERVLVARRM